MTYVDVLETESGDVVSDTTRLGQLHPNAEILPIFGNVVYPTVAPEPNAAVVIDNAVISPAIALSASVQL
jgi:hypothetical protein